MQAMLTAVLFGLVLAVVQCSEKKFEMDWKTRNEILHDKRIDVFQKKNIEFYMKNPFTQKQKECYAKLESGHSIDFVLDLAPSPNLDEIDKRCANSPVGLYLHYRSFFEPSNYSPSKAYFDAIQDFIDAVTYDVKPECSHVVLWNKDDKRMFYLRGREVDADLKDEGFTGEFNDLKRNLKTMWPVSTESKPDEAHLRRVVKSNLGRLTKLALWSRDNGLPVVLYGSERSKSVYTVVITDGSSGAKINDLTTDLSRTTVIDIGENRFADRLSWDEMKRLVNVVSLPAPQSLLSMINSVRTMLCWLIENKIE